MCYANATSSLSFLLHFPLDRLNLTDTSFLCFRDAISFGLNEHAG
jgi:hypothetical protein